MNITVKSARLNGIDSNASWNHYVLASKFVLPVKKKS